MGRRVVTENEGQTPRYIGQFHEHQIGFYFTLNSSFVATMRAMFKFFEAYALSWLLGGGFLFALLLYAVFFR